MKFSNLIIVTMLLMVCFSCDDLNDKHSEYLTETIYPGRIDSLRTYIGIEKVYMAWEKPTDNKANKTIINYGTEEIVFDTAIDTIVVTELDSGQPYNFEIFSIDVNDNQSVKLYADLLPVSKDWIARNMFLSKPIVTPTDGVNVNSLTFSWKALNNDVMKYKDGLEFSLTDENGNEITSDISDENNVEDGVLIIEASNLDVNKSYTLSYKMSFSPIVDSNAILDTTPLIGEITFVPQDFALDPIYLLAESTGWDESSFITIAAVEPGKYVAQNISFSAGEVFRAFKEPSLSSEEQYGFSSFDVVSALMKVSDDGNDNFQLVTTAPGVYNLTIETTSKIISLSGTYDGIIEFPGTLQAENYNTGGAGVAYSDKDTNNRGNTYRDEGVDISGGPSPGFNVGWTNDGEWLAYTVEVLETGSYTVNFSISSQNGTVGQLVLKFDEEEKLVFQATGTGSWSSYTNQLGGEIELEAGIYELKVEMRNPALNFDALTLTKN
ncbi:MAG: carbohydrate-binding protein [Algibacter sp.]